MSKEHNLFGFACVNLQKARYHFGLLLQNICVFKVLHFSLHCIKLQQQNRKLYIAQ